MHAGCLCKARTPHVLASPPTATSASWSNVWLLSLSAALARSRQMRRGAWGGRASIGPELWPRVGDVRGVAGPILSRGRLLVSVLATNEAGDDLTAPVAVLGIRWRASEPVPESRVIASQDGGVADTDCERVEDIASRAERTGAAWALRRYHDPRYKVRGSRSRKRGFQNASITPRNPTPCHRARHRKRPIYSDSTSGASRDRTGDLLRAKSRRLFRLAI
jgi:hypothetical protein